MVWWMCYRRARCRNGGELREREGRRSCSHMKPESMKRLGRGRRRVYGTAASAASQWKCLLPKAGPRASGPLGLLLLWHLAFQRGPVRRLSLGARRKVSLRAPPCPRRLRGELLGIPVAHSHSSLSSPPLHTHPAKARPPARCSTPAPQRIARALSVCRRAACAPAHPHHPATEISAWPYRSRWRTAWLHQFSENRIRQAQSPRWTARRSQRPGTQSGLVVKLVRLFAWCLQLCLCSPSALRRQPPSRQPPGIARGRCWLSLPRPSAARGPP